MSDSRNTRMRFEQWARNPRCEANTLSAVHGVRMSDVARHESVPPSMGQSPFAIARGVMFERSLLRDDAKILRDSLERAGVLPTGSRASLVDLRTRQNGGRLRDLDAARAQTDTLLRD